MTEQEAIERVDEPLTVASLTADLRDLGLEAGDTVLVHSSLGSLGWVCGGPQAVVDALLEVVTESGTVVMPTHSTQYSDPRNWSNPPVPDDWVPIIEAEMPPFRPAVTPTRGMGAVPECFRQYPGTVRSRHPEVSFAAWGAHAEDVVSEHSYDFSLGDGSPLGEVYEHGGSVLLLGVGHPVNTSLHLAEYRAALDVESFVCSAVVAEDGDRTRIEYEDIPTSTDDFPEVGAAFEREVGCERGTVGAAETRLLDQCELVDFATDWFETNR
jgi:aminoglycoside 3-N-acetyltransferase